ncbi:imidazoleglycerol phosphate synthase, cyclase subunit [Cladophialophora bantiana CBS 173.52]|uniref:Imidazole glycerol phosphate synthase hisHF n=1 Tax=Cladophialophora bantiana (strain ATCC 10958 / CBS 173.52 / CDC B-1940 / NIH 8579) TaxID=1442370 RepID=A0A0D2F0U7_CLAB1|nr:imidazoleglycerol phosphate synthase, cyclase subunit [Cladophialophora bantiana CBS 173.52]KIW95851.1 imidazoleglycerol phosphate synthase, cyclase subunit [Cladophialophora bantiana CBS 173.52]
MADFGLPPNSVHLPFTSLLLLSFTIMPHISADSDNFPTSLTQKIILPGVGHFGHCLTSLSTAGYLPAIQSHISSGKPFFGICVGLQALFTGSEEAPSVTGLNIIPTSLKRFSAENADASKKSVPCIGWNDASTLHHDSDQSHASALEEGKSFYGLNQGSKYYYVHSYFAPYVHGELEAEGWVVATATYGDETYVGAIGKGNVFATQFHPEKSGAAGLRVIKAFLEGTIWSDPVFPSVPGTSSTTANGFFSSLAGRTADGGTNGLTRRIIACLDVRTNDQGDLVVTKGDQYDVREKSSLTSATGPGQVRNLGKPVDMARRYYEQGADEITFLNITSFRDCPITDIPMLEILRRTSETVFVPLTIGGGIRDMTDPVTGKNVSALDVAKLYFASGADKVSIGSDAVLAAEEYHSSGGNLSGTTSIETISAAYGAQAVVVSVDPKRIYVSSPSDTAHHTIRTAFPDPQGREYVWYACTIKGGRETRDLDVVQLCTAVQALGAGEILLNAIDRDGSNRGYDLELINMVKAAVGVPVIASSGAGVPGHFEEVFRRTGVDAALGAGMVKEHLGQAGLLVRPFEEF